MSENYILNLSKKPALVVRSRTRAADLVRTDIGERFNEPSIREQFREFIEGRRPTLCILTWVWSGNIGYGHYVTAGPCEVEEP